RQQAQMRASVIHNELGNEEFKKDDLDRAFYEYSLSTQYYGGFALPWYNRGSVLLRQNKKQEAIQEFVQAVGVDPTNLPSLVKLVTLYEELNRFSDAASIYDTIARLTPNSPEGQFAAKKQPITKARGFWVDKNYTAAQELFDNILADQPNNADAWYFLALMNDERGKLTEAADYMQKAVALRSNNPLIRMQLAGIYEKLEMEELAEEEYRRVLFMGVGAEQGNEVMERLNAVESSLSGFSRRMNYSFSYDSNAAMNDLIPAYELSSALSVGVIYANKFAEDLRFNLQFNPVYTTFHKNNFDFWRLGMNYSMIKGGVDRSWSFNYGSDKIVDIENGKSTSNSGSISVRNSRRIFLPALLGLAPEGMEHDLQPTAVDLFFSVRDAESSENQPLLSVTPSFGVSAAQTLAGGVSGSISYSVATSRNKQHTVKFTTFDDSTVDVFSGRRTQGNLTTVKTFDSRDFEYDSHVMSLGLNRMLRPGLRGAIGGNVGYTNYINVDSIDGEKRRQNLAFGLNLGFSMIMQKNVSLYGSFDWQKMRSNMAINSQVASGVKPLAENLQSTGLGGFSKFTMTIGTQMQF
ncbi:MAG: tetratricopeptide repeat protein, partial [Gammaproteobacteria bacterium]|nr:tetratricopeptide repeat protein [Gammaproteobacteria bacterium]